MGHDLHEAGADPWSGRLPRMHDAGVEPGGPEGTREDRAPRVTVLVRARCPTCDRMVEVVRRVCADAAAAWVVVDVDAPDTDPDLRGEFADVVPVTLIDGREIASHTLGERVLRAALDAQGPR